MITEINRVLFLSMVGLVSCGETPSFIEKGQDALLSTSSEDSESSSENAVGDATSADTDVEFESDPIDPESPKFVIPGLKHGEAEQIAQCIKKWKGVPFAGTFTNVRRIKATVSVNGTGTPIDDVAQTAAPELVLIDAGINIKGSPTYNLLNDNGYYCMKLNVNVHTDLNVNLACNAKLADNSVQVDVNSSANSSISKIGINVDSTVTVNQMTPTGGACND